MVKGGEGFREVIAWVMFAEVNASIHSVDGGFGR